MAADNEHTERTNNNNASRQLSSDNINYDLSHTQSPSRWKLGYNEMDSTMNTAPSVFCSGSGKEGSNFNNNYGYGV